VADQHGAGESFTRFSVRQNDLFIGDRVYGVRPGIFHVVEGDGEVLVRFAMTNLPLHTLRGRPFHLLKRLRGLTGKKLGDWPVLLKWKNQELAGRVCAIKKSRQAAQRAQKRIIRVAQKHGSKTKPETLELAKYTFVFTTIEQEQLNTTNILEMYRGRWQIELVFKRLKSILGLGHLPKTDKQSATAWLHGKLLVALLIEALLCHGETFFPWGYPIRQTQRTKP
jgi:hypothetical protein